MAIQRKNKFYVYLHRNNNGNVFYIGKGTGKRAYSKVGRSDKWKEASKDGYYVDIAFDNLTEEESLSIEMKLIEGIGLDNLTNLSIGGDGGRFDANWEMCKEYIESISALIYLKNNIDLVKKDESLKNLLELSDCLSSLQNEINVI